MLKFIALGTLTGGKSAKETVGAGAQGQYHNTSPTDLNN